MNDGLAPGWPRQQPPAGNVPDLSAAEVQRLQDEALAACPPGDGVWVFAYGSLMWDGSFRCSAAYPAELEGFERRYCIWDGRERGTPELRSLTLGLLPGPGVATGLAMHIAGADVATEFPKVWRHEMPGGFYRAEWVDVAARKFGPVRALTFVAKPEHPMFAGAVGHPEIAAVLARTSGPGGRARDYLRSTAEALRAAGVRDDRMDALARAVGA